jgi:hypothetical protein
MGNFGVTGWHGMATACSTLYALPLFHGCIPVDSFRLQWPSAEGARHR